jgi:hypothetical protein
MKIINTPELDKMSLVKEDSQKLGEFLDWLTSERIILCTRGGEDFVPNGESIEVLLARYFEIDLHQVEEERREILASYREPPV